MKTKLILSLALIIAFFLVASSLPVSIPIVQASGPATTLPNNIEDQAAVESISIETHPLALGLIGLICLIFGVLTITPLLHMDAYSGVAATNALENPGIKLDQH